MMSIRATLVAVLFLSGTLIPGSRLSAAPQQVVNVDFGNRAGTFSGQGVLKDVGNNFWNGVGASATNLLASDGTTATGISVQLKSSGDHFYANSNGMLADYHYVSSFGNPVGALRIEGLEKGANYLIYVYSAGDKVDQGGVLVLNGVKVKTSGSTDSTCIDGLNYRSLEVKADASGVIAGTFEPINVSGAINGLQITKRPRVSRVTRIVGAESPIVRSPGDRVLVTLEFNDTVSLSSTGGAELTIDFEGTKVAARHRGATTGKSLGFEALAPAVTTMRARVTSNSLRLVGSTLTDSRRAAVRLEHAAAPLPNDQVSVKGLSVYTPIPGLAESRYYRFRVRKSGGAWMPSFACFTKCPDHPTAEYGYYSQFIGGWSHSYCNFEMADNVPVEVEITRLDPATQKPVSIQSAVPHPRRLVKSWQVEGGRAYVTLERPALFAVDINAELDTYDTSSGPRLNEKAIHAVSVFANPFILDKPKLSDPGVRVVKVNERAPETGPWTTLVFEPGVHQLHQGTWKAGGDFRLHSGKSYYIPGDAIVHGNMNNRENPNDASKIRIFGHGTLSGERIDHPQHLKIPLAKHIWSRPIRIGGDARGCRIEGVTIADPAHHSCAIDSRFHARPEDYNYIRWTKVLGWRANGDGISPNGSGYVEDCFIRAQDDGTYILGFGIRRMVYWHDVNGMPLRCSQMTKFNDAALDEPLCVEDIDVIYARTHFVGDAGPAGRSVIGYPDPDNAFPGTNGSHVIFRNINVEDTLPTRMLFGWDLKQGTGKTGGSGAIHGVRFENVRAAAANIDKERDILKGDLDAPISGLIFDNVTLGGRQYSQMSDFVTNQHSTALVFKNTAPQTLPYRNASGRGKWYAHSDWDAGVEPARHDLVQHTSVAGELIVDAPAYAGSVRIGHSGMATLSIRKGGHLRVSDRLAIGVGGRGKVAALDGVVTLVSDKLTALSIGNSGKLHIERGEVRWAGDHMQDARTLAGSGAITFTNGRAPQSASPGVQIAVFGSTCLFAHYDASRNETSIYATEAVSSLLLLGLAPFNAQFGPDPRDFLLVSQLLALWPVSPSTLPALDVPQDSKLNGLKLYYQVAMINPLHVPQDPLQLSNGLKAVIGGAATPYGSGSGIRLSAASGPRIGQPFRVSFGF